MGEHTEYTNLNWVKSAIDETLQQARQALEFYVEDPADATQIQFCANYLHQVVGTLQMLELYGAALLAEEMEHLATALQTPQISHREAAYEILMQAILQLDDYLERVQRGQRDIPIVLLPLLNDLRASQGRNLLSEGSLFLPDLTVNPPQHTESVATKEDIQQLSRRLRPIFESGLLGWFRGKEPATSLKKMGFVVDKLDRVSTWEVTLRLWWVSLGFLEALFNKGIGPSTSVNLLLGQLDRQIKKVSEQGEEGIAHSPPTEFLKNLLYYLAKAKPKGKRVRQLKEAFRLEALLPGELELTKAQEGLSGPSLDAMTSVSEALREDLSRIKENLDLFVRSEDHGVAKLQPLQDMLRQVSDTLGMLGLGIPRKVVKEQMERINNMLEGSVPTTDARLMDIAGALLYVESSLAELDRVDVSESAAETLPEATGLRLSTGDLTQLRKNVLGEVSADMGRAKEAIVSFIAGPWQHDLLDDVPELFGNIQGALGMLSLTRARDLLAACRSYISEQLLDKRIIPDQSSLDRLADAITSIEYYLETINEDRGVDESILDIAESSLISLGYAPVSRPIDLSAQEMENPAVETLKRLALALDHWLSSPTDGDACAELRSVAQQIPERAEDDAVRQKVAKIATELDAMVGMICSRGGELTDDIANTLRWAHDTLSRLLLGGETGGDETEHEAPPVPRQAQELAAHALSEPVITEATEPAETLPSPQQGTASPSEEEAQAEPVPPQAFEIPPETTEPAVSGLAPAPVAEAQASEAIPQDEAPTQPAVEPEREKQPSVETAADVSAGPVRGMEFEALADEVRAQEALPAAEEVDAEEVADEEGVDVAPGAPVAAVAEEAPIAEAVPIEATGAEFTDEEGVGAAPEAPVEAVAEEAPIAEAVPIEATEAEFTDEEGVGAAPEVPVAAVAEEAPIAEAVPIEATEAEFTDEEGVGAAPEVPVEAVAEEESLAAAEEIDEELLEIFLEEAAEVQQSIQEVLPQWLADPLQQQEALTTLRRSFHTLKGSGRMVGATRLGEYGWAFENLLNRVIDGSVSPHAEIVSLVEQGAAALPALIEQLKTGMVPTVDVDDLMGQAEQMSQPDSQPRLATEPSSFQPMMEEFPENAAKGAAHAESVTLPETGEKALDAQAGVELEAPATEKEQTAVSMTQLLEELTVVESTLGVDQEAHPALEEVDEAFEDITEMDRAGSSEPSDAIISSAQSKRWDREEMIDQELLQVFAEEAALHIGNVESFLRQSREQGERCRATDELTRSLHTLSSSAYMATIQEVSEICGLLESVFRTIRDRPASPAPEALVVLQEGMAASRSIIEALQDPSKPLPETNTLITHISAIVEEQGLQLSTAESGIAKDEDIGMMPQAQIAGEANVDEAFLEQGLQRLDQAEDILAEWQRQPAAMQYAASLSDVFNRLDQAATEAGFPEIYDLARAMHARLDAVAQGHIAPGEMLRFSGSACDTLLNMLQRVHAHRPVLPAAELIKQLEVAQGGVEATAEEPEKPAEKYAEEGTAQVQDRELGKRTSEPWEDSSHPFVSNEVGGDHPPPPQNLPETSAVEDLGPSGDSQQVQGNTADRAPAPAVELTEYDPELVEIFLEEGQEILDTAEDTVERWQKAPDDRELVDTLQRHLHTLKGTSRMAGLPDIGELSHRLESLFAAVVDDQLRPSEPIFELVQVSHDRLVEMLERVRAHQALVPATDLLQRIDKVLQAQPQTAVAETVPGMPPEVIPEGVENTASAGAESAGEAGLESPDYDNELVEIFLQEGQEILEATDEALATWQRTPDAREVVETLQRQLHTLKGSSRMAGLPELGELSHRLESLFAAVVDHQLAPSEAIFSVVQAAYDRLVEMLEEARTEQAVTPATELLQQLDGILKGEQAPTDVQPTATEAPTVSAISPEVPERDPELVEIFLEEGQEILDATDEMLERWQHTPQDPQQVGELQRHLHTLKGSSRMAGLPEIGELSHRLESLFASVVDARLTPSRPLFDLVHQSYDCLVDMLSRLRQDNTIEPATELIEQIERVLQGEAPTSATLEAVSEVKTLAESAPRETPVVHRLPTPPSRAVETEKPTTLLADSVPQPVEVPPAQAIVLPFSSSERARQAQEQQAGAARPAPQEQVRVRAEVLSNLVNFAGELSISRSRIEQQMSAARTNLAEMEQTVTRLRDQLRRFEIETEAQILYRYEDSIHVREEDFDPLELDRFSQMQQLSRGLLESLGDLVSIREAMENSTRETETLLLQQSRINTELQEGLMRTRMVPFAGLVPRLRRIVRQVCAELGKQVDFRVVGAEGKMDRSLLDRMAPPLEHMLRNALDHGIETPERRRATKKPEVGTITLSVEREGTEIVIELQDDGAGIDLAAVARKAEARGLLHKGAHLTDNEVMQFILEAGFSTAQKITQISGRGVGMDVVNSEIKQLHGSLHISSEKGQGSRFTVRLPLTLATSQTLMTQVSEELYAVPLANIEGIIRVRGDFLDRYYGPQAMPLEYAGQAYQLLYLGALLGGRQPRAQAGQMLPLLLTRAGDHRVAVLVDDLLGSRDVVIKSVGPQISTVHGISGATIMGDGRVVLILDIVALVRIGIARQWVTPAAETIAEEVEKKQVPTVMVVDDSITVRKVTARLLQRHGMDVVTAKDGVDAIAKLQDSLPDIMLLDVEMPRMDGYELAAVVRNNTDFQHIPMIMITSRTGQKHRDRAASLGVDIYMGKPYQESDLLNNIHKLLGEQA